MDAPPPATPPQAGFRSRLALIGLGVMLFAIGQSLLFTIVSPLARKTGLSEIQFGLILTLASLPLVIGAPFWGKKSDTAGRRPVFVFGLLGSAVGTALVAVTIEARLAGWISVTGLMIGLLASRALYSVTASAIYPAAGGYIADVTDIADRGKGMAILGASNSFGAVLGPLMAATLAFAGALFPMYVAAVLMGVGAIAALKMMKEPERHAAGSRVSTLKASDPRLRPFMIMWFVFFLTFSSVQIVTGFFIQDRLGITDQAAIVRVASFCLISMAVMITLVQGLVLQVFHVGPTTLLRLCGPAFIASLLTMSVATTPAVLMAGFAILGLAFACATPGINGGASLAVAAHEQGAASGYLSAANTVGAILGPIYGTSLYRLAPTAVMYAGAALFLAVSVYAMTVEVPVRPARGG